MLEQPRPDLVPEQVVIQAPLQARFLLFAPEYVPEVVDVDLPAGCSVLQALECVQAFRTPHLVSRFSVLVPVRPQTLAACALCLALPPWCVATYVLLDCSRVSGAVFCAPCAEVTTRASLFAIARLPRDRAIDVYVQDRVLPLQEGDAIGIRTGYSIVFVPADHPPFVVTYVADMLQDPLSWDRAVPLPGVDGLWRYLLTDDEPMQFLPSTQRRGTLRDAIARALGYDMDRLVIQPTRPNLSDHFDFGIWGWSTLVVSQEVPRDPTTVLYVLDMRPVLCGITWGTANLGRVRVGPIIQRFRALCPAGYRPALHGGRHEGTRPSHIRIVVPGSVLVVTFEALLAAGQADTDDTSGEDQDAGPERPDDSDQVAGADSQHPGYDAGGSDARHQAAQVTDTRTTGPPAAASSRAPCFSVRSRYGSGLAGAPLSILASLVCGCLVGCLIEEAVVAGYGNGTAFWPFPLRLWAGVPGYRLSLLPFFALLCSFGVPPSLEVFM